ncbi:DUF397 domain-containing protein [Streptomyces aidingensis]|uniref:DUF397 domain-containing protein n=1 Tax=Streptomyces aidingensis TaxID=910347 RepID=A0A1I1DYJ0_9ACTN|nr:DUF397 domain-containing protein [Streptomyces aidingensis]SFB80109.1 protein of unknown function [Streptomyces aidingensis]
MRDDVWQKSSFSSGEPTSTCVEIAVDTRGRDLLFRESEQSSGPVLVTSRGRLAALLVALRR